MWGAYHGVLLIVARAAGSLAARARREGGWLRPLQIAGMFVLTLHRLVDLPRDRARSSVARSPADSPWRQPRLAVDAALYLFLLAALYSLPLWIHDIWAEAGGPTSWPPPLTRPKPQYTGVASRCRRVVCGLMLAAVLTLRSSASLNFIYFSF